MQAQKLADENGAKIAQNVAAGVVGVVNLAGAVCMKVLLAVACAMLLTVAVVQVSKRELRRAFPLRNWAREKVRAGGRLLRRSFPGLAIATDIM